MIVFCPGLSLSPSLRLAFRIVAFHITGSLFLKSKRTGEIFTGQTNGQQYGSTFYERTEEQMDERFLDLIFTLDFFVGVVCQYRVLITECHLSNDFWYCRSFLGRSRPLDTSKSTNTFLSFGCQHLGLGVEGDAQSWLPNRMWAFPIA